MTGSRTVLAVEDDASVPDCADHWLCHEVHDWSGPVVIDVPAAHDTDLERARTVLQEVADATYAQDEWVGVLLAAPEFPGVEQISTESTVLRLTVRTTDTDPWRVGRELRISLGGRFDAEAIRTPLPLLGSVPCAGTGPR